MLVKSEERRIVSAAVPTELRDELARLAAAEERSLSGEIRKALVAHVSRSSKPGRLV